MSTLHIAICEDQEDEYQTLRKIILNSPCQSQIEHFSEGGALLKDFCQGKYDLILLDIYMEGTGGIAAAEKIRELDDLVPIAFVTTSPDHALEAFRCHAMRYLLKPLKEEEVFEVLETAMREKRHEQGAVLRIDGAELFLPFRSIAYIEQRNHNMEIHTSDGRILVSRGKIDALPEDDFPEPPFLRCHKSFLVNLMHVNALDEALLTFEMANGDHVYIRRQSLRESKEAFLRFMFARTRGKSRGVSS